MPTKDEYYLPYFIFWDDIREKLNKFLAKMIIIFLLVFFFYDNI
jgi:hypothetical protein